MNEQKKQKLLEQYDDAAFALLMDEYAEEEGARLRKEFEEAQAAGEVSDTSDALDEKCLQMIHRDFAKKRGKDNVRKIIRMTSKVAVAVMVFLGVVTATIFSVDAFRIPVLNFIFTQYQQYSSINIEETDTNTLPIQVEDYLLGLLPSSFYQTNFSSDSNATFASYKDTNGSSIQFLMTVADGIHNIDTEGSTTSEIDLGYSKAILIEKEGYRIIWYDERISILFDIRSTGLEKNDFIMICEALCAYYNNK